MAYTLKGKTVKINEFFEVEREELQFDMTTRDLQTLAFENCASAKDTFLEENKDVLDIDFDIDYKEDGSEFITLMQINYIEKK